MARNCGPNKNGICGMSQGIYNPFFQNGAPWYGDGGDAGLRIEKQNTVLIYITGQSNSGTDPNTGRVPPASMPTYLKPSPYSNVYFFDIALASTNAFAAYTPGASGREMGYIDQIIYV